MNNLEKNMGVYKILSKIRHLLRKGISYVSDSNYSQKNKDKKRAEPNVLYVNNVREAFKKKTKKVGQIVSAEGNKPEGVFITINKDWLKRNKGYIKKGIINRNDDVRRAVDVIGYKNVPEKYVIVKGKKEYLYHRTHLIPFRYGLSEGDTIKNLLITATTHLNNGNRPKYNYYVPKTGNSIDTNENRVNSLIELLNYSTEIKNINVFPEKDIHYSIDDVERLTDYFINYYKDTVFTYGVFCNYTKNQEIPTSVTACLKNSETNKLIFKITLSNLL